MKTKLLIAIAGVQILTLGWIAGQREWILHAGRSVYFRTAPIDPRDAMRGDYVRLSYDMSHVPRSLCQGALAQTQFDKLPRDSVVYSGFEVGEDNVANLRSVALEPPAQGLYLRGRTESSSGALQVRYGLEAFFMEQGKGLQLEQGRNRDGIQVPLEMGARVSPHGVAVLKDYRWCPVGIGLELETKEGVSTNGLRERRVIAAKVRLLNASSNALAVIDFPGGRSLALVPDGTWSENPWHWSPPPETQPVQEPAQVVVLKPGELHTIRISFDDPRWSVTKETPGNSSAQRMRLTELRQDWSARFRMEYRSSVAAAYAKVPNANLVWRGTLVSRAFNPAGNID